MSLDGKQGVALTGRYTTGPPRAAPGELHCICECYRRRQTPATVTSVPPYTMCRRASNNVSVHVGEVRSSLSRAQKVLEISDWVELH